jgi:hypothetical protein
MSQPGDCTHDPVNEGEVTLSADWTALATPHKLSPMVMKSTLSILPDVVTLRRKAQSLALLDAIMSPNWQYRYYSFNSKWGTDEMMASRKNGSGDELYILFSPFGAILKGFDHESLMSPWTREDQSLWPQVFDGVPMVFKHFLGEPAFDIPNTTFCVWAPASR